MRIDWTTFVLEIINFLALVWILKRFLYKPVLETLTQRRAGVERILAESRATEARATALQSEFEHRLADWESEKANAREHLEADLAKERSLQLQALSVTLKEERERSAAVDAHKRQEIERELETRAMAQAQQFTTALLTRLAAPSIEAGLVNQFLEDWAKLPEPQLDNLRRAAEAENTGAMVTSAFPLSSEQQQQITTALATRLERGIAITFGEDRQLMSGIRVSLGSWHLHLNFADELSCFASVSVYAD